MGLFSGLATLPLAPVRGVVWVAEQLAEEADRRLYDEDTIKRELFQLEIDEQDGVISAEEREAMERDLLDRLAVARRRAAEEEELLTEPEPEPEPEQGKEVIDGGGVEVERTAP
jgi:hypothetical protein